jgi:hypothetical protein
MNRGITVFEYVWNSKVTATDQCRNKQLMIIIFVEFLETAGKGMEHLSNYKKRTGKESGTEV